MTRLIVGLACLAAGCTTAADMPPQATARAVVRDTGSTERAQAAVSQTANGLMVSIQAIGMTPGSYGAHLHAVGRCDPPDFASAGPHWNPTGRQHGKENPLGMHLGDLPNLTVGSDGRGSAEMVIPDASLTDGSAALLDTDGAAVVIHAAADDYRTDPSGNSGARVACGVLAAG